MASVQALLQQGWQLHQAGQLEQAEALYRSVLDVEPKNADAHVYLGIVAFDQRRFEASVESYREALAIRHRFPVAWNNLGNSLRMLGRVEEAEECFAKALTQQPGYLSALKNRGTLWIWSGEIKRGLRWYQEGLRHAPDNAELHRNLGVIHLLLGEYDVGWQKYRWRWKMPGMYRPPTRAPRWNGEPIAGKTILLYAEQGLGDAIQFLRVAAELEQRGAKVIVQCSERFLPLFTSAPGIDRFVLENSPIPSVDFHASLIEVVDVLYSLTGEICWGESLFESDRGYLTVSAELIAYWKRWIDAEPQPIRVGINWQGNPGHHADVYRSIPLQSLAPLSAIPGVTLINLQHGFGVEQIESVDFGSSILRLPQHVDTDGGAFTDTAAILPHLDLIVTTDTSLAHLAGAVGAPVTLMLGQVPDWRWLRTGRSTRWYPTMKLERQQQLGTWTDVIHNVTAEVMQLSQRSSSTGKSSSAEA